MPQIRKPEYPGLAATLAKISRCFRKFGMQRHWAIGTPHYETEPPPTLVMVHKQIARTKYCIPLETDMLNITKLKPHTYKLHKGHLQPTEFELLPNMRNPRPDPPAHFLIELGLLLCHIRHGTQFFLVPREPELMFLAPLQRDLVDGCGGYCTTPYDDGNDVHFLGFDYLETQWCFDAPAPGAEDLSVKLQLIHAAEAE